MANSAQAKKRARQNVKARKHNASLRSMVRTYIKRTLSAIAGGDYAVATEAYKKADIGALSFSFCQERL
ncbi:hypothetical protein DMB35_19110 [Acinetobacter baumannii A424]|nr:hypothetical protein DMB35_19110 [Acinetobacter baumannii A424]